MSSLTVTGPQAIKLLSRGRARQVLGAFLSGESTVAAVARQTGLDIRLTWREVQALEGAGLLRQVGEHKRGGRPIKRYAAAAPTFFVPFSATGAADLAELGGERARLYDQMYAMHVAQEFARLNHAQGGGREWGLRLYLDSDGLLQADASYEGAELVSPAVRYQGPVGLLLDVRADVYLTQTEAEEVQRELAGVLMRLHPLDLANRQGGSGQPFLLRLGLVSVPREDAQKLD